MRLYKIESILDGELLSNLGIDEKSLRYRMERCQLLGPRTQVVNSDKFDKFFGESFSIHSLRHLQSEVVCYVVKETYLVNGVQLLEEFDFEKEKQYYMDKGMVVHERHESGSTHRVSYITEYESKKIQGLV